MTAGISVIIPAYNEGAGVYDMISETVRAMREIAPDHEIIVIDDGSTDGTPDAIARAIADFEGVTTVRLPENVGKGNAVKRGFQASTKELVCFLDADLDIHPYQVRTLLEEMERSGSDVVVGSKRHPLSKVEYPRVRRFYSSIFYYLILVLFHLPIRDSQTGIKLFKREVLERCLPRIVNMRFVLDLELLLVANYLGYSISSAPVRISYQREFGRITFRDVRGIIVDTMSLFYRFYILGYYGSPFKPTVEYEPRVAVIVPFRTVDPMVEECVRKCSEMNYSNFEVRLVPDSPIDMELSPARSAVLPSGPIGPAVKRNIGAEGPGVDILAFIDADAYPDYDWLRNAIPYFEDERVAAVGGPAVTPASDNRRQQASGAIYSATLVSGGTRYRYRPHAFRRVDDYPTSNLLVRKSDFDAVGGFHEEFWPGEDTVLCWKLTKELGKQILYVPNVLVNHHRRAVYVPHLRQVYSYAVHRGFFVKKYPETSRKLQYFIPSFFLMALLAGLVAGAFSEFLLIAYLAAVGAYLLLALVSSVKTLSLAINLLVFPGIVATHLTYGAGFIVGLTSRRMREQ